MKNEILLVDDEKDIREILCLALVDMGYTVRQAKNGVEALRIFNETQPPLVLTDIKMPGMDGIDLLQKIKRVNPEVEVVMITGHGDMDLAIKSLKFEATDFITKPINVDALEISLQRAQDKILIRQQLKEYTENLEKLVQEKTELQDHLSSLGLMISSISHGIKGLLTGLDGGMYLLDSGLAQKDPDRINEGWDAVKQMVERIRKMVLDILFYAKERDLKWERINALSFAEEIARVLEPKLSEHDIEFDKKFDRKIGEFEVDAGYIHSALFNILENAVDACTLDKKNKAPKISFCVGQDEDYIDFEVIDNGIGMDPETQAKIFTAFFSAKGEKGTGLGLFIANKIIEQHGGHISVTSTLGKGTRFRIRIPKIMPQAVKMKSQKMAHG
jgi:signal transduction histidine kinase